MDAEKGRPQNEGSETVQKSIENMKRSLGTVSDTAIFFFTNVLNTVMLRIHFSVVC